MKKEINIIMCGSNLSVKGGIVSVIKNFLNYTNWQNYNIKFIPTHLGKGKIIEVFYFFYKYIQILFIALISKSQILYMHTAERGSFYRKAILLRTLKKFGFKTILHHHGAEFDDFYFNSSTKNKIFINQTLEQADLNIVLSKRLIPMILDKAPLAKVTYLYNAVNTYKDNPYNKESKNVLFLGRLGQRKGTFDLLKVIKSLDDRIDKDIKFYLCGDGEIDKTKKMVGDLKIEHRIKHIGWIDMNMKKEILSNSMINILPSYNEGLPMTILETMAYGIPNISTQVASIPEVIVNDGNGFLVNPGDIETIANLLFELINNNEKRFAMSKKSWELINNEFDINIQINKLINILNKI